MNSIGLLGGTFDPVHQGHLHLAEEVLRLLDVDEVRFLPCHLPPHRDQPRLSSDKRLHLITLAIADQPRFSIDDRELRRDGPSYTVDSLRSLREELGEQVSLVWILGMDAFEQLTTWHQWQSLPELAHIAVMMRPGYTQGQWPLPARPLDSSSYEKIRTRAAGQVVLLNQRQSAVSATAIREGLALGKVPKDLPSDVLNYIMEQKLYNFTINQDDNSE